MNIVKEMLYGTALLVCMIPFLVAALAMGVPTV